MRMISREDGNAVATRNAESRGLADGELRTPEKKTESKMGFQRLLMTFRWLLAGI